MIGFKGVIFDCDGVLLDSMRIWYVVEEEFLRSIGKEPRPNILDELKPLNGFEVAEYYQAEYGVDMPAVELLNRRDVFAAEFYANEVTLKEGVVGILDTLRARGIRMCVASASHKSLIESGLGRCGILWYFEKIFSCVEECTTKNSPDIFIRAAASMGTMIKDTLVIEDALHAIVSAKKAGFPVIGVYDFSHAEEQDEIKRLSDHYLESIGGMMELLQT